MARPFKQQRDPQAAIRRPKNLWSGIKIITQLSQNFIFKVVFVAVLSNRHNESYVAAVPDRNANSGYKVIPILK